MHESNVAQSQHTMKAPFIFKVLLAWSGLNATVVALSTNDAPVVTIKNGTYYGKHLPSFNQDVFLGMPFAQPPVGDLRFANPVPLFNESWTETRNATEYGYWCYGQNNAAEYNPNEDCLTLNVIRPTGYTGQQLPVAAWIYGGGFYAVSYPRNQNT